MSSFRRVTRKKKKSLVDALQLGGWRIAESRGGYSFLSSLFSFLFPSGMRSHTHGWTQRIGERFFIVSCPLSEASSHRSDGRTDVRRKGKQTELIAFFFDGSRCILQPGSSYFGWPFAVLGGRDCRQRGQH